MCCWDTECGKVPRQKLCCWRFFPTHSWYGYWYRHSCFTAEQRRLNYYSLSKLEAGLPRQYSVRLLSGCDHYQHVQGTFLQIL
jgi:hypothetical protein